MKKLILLIFSCMMFAAGCSALPGLGGQTSSSSFVITESSYSSYINPESTGAESSFYEESSVENSEPESSFYEESSVESSEPESSFYEESSVESSEPESSSSKESTVDSSELESSSSEESSVESSEAEDSSSEESAVDSSEPESNSSEESSPESSEPESSEPESSEDSSSELESSELESSEDSSSELESSEIRHTYEPVIVLPTCEEGGYTIYTCSLCGDWFKTDIVPSVGHTYKSVTTQPTCEEDGYTTYTCLVCEDSYETDVVPSTGHSYKGVKTLPTCEEEGYTTYTCLVCEDFYEGDVVPSTGHSYKGVKTLPTCEKDGYTTYTCLVCQALYVGDETPAVGHDWVDATTEKPKTCKTCGKTEGEKLPAVSPDKMLYVNYIDVGQGDSIFIKVGDCDILIDGGVAAQGTTVSKYLKNQGVDDVELMINTHPDADHCGGLTQVLKDFKVEEVWAPSRTATSATYKNFAAAVKSEGLTAKKPTVGTIFTYEYLTITVLYNGDGASNSNDSSIVVMVQYASFRFLMTGDISSTIENQLASNSNISLKCDVLKVAHHGSKYSSSSTFLKATGAKYGVICVGDNDYGHPTSTALNNLKSAGISVYRTDTNGDIVFSTNGESLQLPGNGGTVSGGSASFATDSSASSSSSSSSSSSGSSADTFIGNKESKIFHLPTCGNLPDVSKRNYLYNYWFIVNCIGYTPCKVCLKNYVP